MESIQTEGSMHRDLEKNSSVFSKTTGEYQKKKGYLDRTILCHISKAKDFGFHSETMRSHQKVLSREVGQEAGEHICASERSH